MSHRYSAFLPKFITPLILAIASSILLTAVPLHAQEALEILNKGFEAFDEQRYQESIQQFNNFLKKFPDHSDAPQARYLVGMAHYNLGNYQKAIPFLTEQKGEDKAFAEEVKQNAIFHLGASNYFEGRYGPAIDAFKEASKKLPPLEPLQDGASEPLKKKYEARLAERKEYDNIRSFALFYLGRAQMDYGSKLNEEEKTEEAKKVWQEGIQHINQMLADFPETALLTDALMTRGTLQVYAGKFNEAEADLQELKSKPEGAAMAAEADYLLGYVYTQQAIELLANIQNEAAKAATEKARGIYRKLSKSDNLVVANEAAFQLANLDFTDKKYKAAIQAYRQLKSKEQLIESQNERLASLRRQVDGADSRQITQIQRAIKREEQKLAAVKANPELSNEAWIKIGESYMQLRDYNKARVVFRHATQFAEPDQKKRLEVQVIISHAAQGNADQADQLFAEFRKQHAKDPLAQNVKYMLGSALMQQERWDEAINAFEESLRDFPESPFSVQIPKDIARIKVQQGKPEEAIQTFRDFIKDGESGKIKVAPAVIEDTQRLLAVTLFQQKNYDEAIQILEDLSSNATTPSIKEESHLQLATILGQTGKNENAVSTYKSFSDTYPNSPSAPKALFQAGALEEKLGKSEEARATFQSLTEKFPENDVAKFAYDKIWKSYKGDLEKVIPAQDALIQAFPDSDQALAALFDRGKMLDKAKEYDSALVAFMDVVERQKNTEAPTEAKSQLAAYSLVTAAPIKQKQATSLGEYKSLDAAGQKQWSELIQSSADLYLQAVTGYPGSKAAAVALNKWVDVMLNLVAVGITKQDAVLNQMSQLAGQMPTEQSKLQIMIAQAGLQNRLGNSDISLKLYDDAFKGVTNMKIIPWQDLSNYGKLLLEAQKWQKALEIFEQLDANTKEENKHAKADANYGRGAALQGLGKLAEAQQFFDLIPKWSPRFMDAKYGSALAQFEAGKLQDAIDTVKEVISSSVSSNESKAKSMILIARSLEGMGDTGQTTPETKQQDGTDKEPYDLACNYLLKVDVLFADATPLLSSEALYHAVRIRKKEKKNQEAQKILDRLLTEYGTTKWGQKARKDY